MISNILNNQRPLEVKLNVTKFFFSKIIWIINLLIIFSFKSSGNRCGCFWTLSETIMVYLLRKFRTIVTNTSHLILFARIEWVIKCLRLFCESTGSFFVCCDTSLIQNLKRKIDIIIFTKLFDFCTINIIPSRSIITKSFYFFFPFYSFYNFYVIVGYNIQK